MLTLSMIAKLDQLNQEDKIKFLMKMSYVNLTNDLVIEQFESHFLTNDSFRINDLVLYNSYIYAIHQIDLDDNASLNPVENQIFEISKTDYEENIVYKGKKINPAYINTDGFNDDSYAFSVVPLSKLKKVGDVKFFSGYTSFNNGKPKKNLSYYASAKPGYVCKLHDCITKEGMLAIYD